MNKPKQTGDLGDYFLAEEARLLEKARKEIAAELSDPAYAARRAERAAQCEAELERARQADPYRYCPRCGSENISDTDYEGEDGEVDEGGRRCDDCDWEGDVSYLVSK